MRATTAPVSPSLAPYQPAQRYVVLDERRVRSDDGPEGNLMAAVVALEQSRSPEDLLRVAAALQRRAWTANEGGLKRAFAEWLGRLAHCLAPGDPPPAAVQTLEDARMTLEERVASRIQHGVRAGGDLVQGYGLPPRVRGHVNGPNRASSLTNTRWPGASSPAPAATPGPSGAAPGT